MKQLNKYRIALIDDDRVNLMLLKKTLAEKYETITYQSGTTFLNDLKNNLGFDLILLDIKLDDISGYNILKKVRELYSLNELPVIMLTSLDKENQEELAFQIGANDYLKKPYSSLLIQKRVEVHLHLLNVNKRLNKDKKILKNKLDLSNDEVTLIEDVIIEMLAQTIEIRDENTGNHIKRTRDYMRVMVEALIDYPHPKYCLSKEKGYFIIKSTPLHDIGKIGISDNILLKKDRLTEEEREEIKKHVAIGSSVIQKTLEQTLNEHVNMDFEQSETYAFLQIANEIIMNHHERWDGLGYPQKISKEEIPLSARLMSIVDTFDALTNERPYKNAWAIEKAFSFIEIHSGHEFDPFLVSLFLNKKEVMKKIHRAYNKEDLKGEPYEKR